VSIVSFFMCESGRCWTHWFRSLGDSLRTRLRLLGDTRGRSAAEGERARHDLAGRIQLCSRRGLRVGEPVEMVAVDGLVDVLHAGAVIATHAQRLRTHQADRVPRVVARRRARDAAAGLTVARLANWVGVVCFGGIACSCRPSPSHGPSSR
jgi:hypothetical protein